MAYIGRHAFWYNTKIEMLTIHNDYISIEEEAFAHCANDMILYCKKILKQRDTQKNI